MTDIHTTAPEKTAYSNERNSFAMNKEGQRKTPISVFLRPNIPRSFVEKGISIKARKIEEEVGRGRRILKEPLPLSLLRDGAPLCNPDLTKLQEKTPGKNGFVNPPLSLQLLASLPALEGQLGKVEDFELRNEPTQRGTPDVARLATNTGGPFDSFEDPNEGFSSRNSSPISIPSSQDKKEEDSCSTEEADSRTKKSLPRTPR